MELRLRGDHPVAGPSRLAAAVVVGVLVTGVWWAPPSAHSRTDVTWSREIVRILDRRCAGCHHPAAVGPMDLTDYADARTWGPIIKRSVLDRRMPPWQASPGFGDFSNDRSLTPYEVGLIVEWVNGGMRVGVPADLPQAAPKRPAFAADLELRAAPRQRITSARHTYELQPGLAKNRWITAWEFRPDDLALVKSAVLLAGDDTLGTWTPDEPATVLPPGVGVRVPAGSPIRAVVSYREPSETDRGGVGLGLRLSEEPLNAVSHLVAQVGTQTLPHRLDLLAIRSTLRSAGDAVQVIARRPDGSSEPLLVIGRYDPDAPATYRFRRPVSLPAGTRLDVLAFEPTCRVVLEYVRSRTASLTPQRLGLVAPTAY